MERSPTITERGQPMVKKLSPVHPEVLLADLLRELSISHAHLGRAIGVSAMRVSHLINGRRLVTAELALRLSNSIT